MRPFNNLSQLLVNISWIGEKKSLILGGQVTLNGNCFWLGGGLEQWSMDITEGKMNAVSVSYQTKLKMRSVCLLANYSVFQWLFASDFFLFHFTYNLV